MITRRRQLIRTVLVDQVNHPGRMLKIVEITKMLKKIRKVTANMIRTKRQILRNQSKKIHQLRRLVRRKQTIKN